jgi:4-hydroxy-4-methyl-2-oxoglutarate aldolase
MDDIVQRYLKLYTGAIADMLDKHGYRRQVLPRQIKPFTTANRIAGPAFTGQGFPCASPTDDDTLIRLDMLESIPAGTVSVWATGGSIDCSQWGEIMSMAARQRGSVGTVMDGGVRDLPLIEALGYPVFARFGCAASSVGRWSIREYNVPIRIGDTLIHPGDFVFGDVDGVVIVPKDLTLRILVDAEDVFSREHGMREDLRRGLPIKEAYAKHGAF